jgi:hypothetical protein
MQSGERLSAGKPTHDAHSCAIHLLRCAGGSLRWSQTWATGLRGVAKFESGKDGKLGVLRLTFAADGQAYEFSRD